MRIDLQDSRSWNTPVLTVYRKSPVPFGEALLAARQHDDGAGTFIPIPLIPHFHAIRHSDDTPQMEKSILNRLLPSILPSGDHPPAFVPGTTIEHLVREREGKLHRSSRSGLGKLFAWLFGRKCVHGTNTAVGECRDCLDNTERELRILVRLKADILGYSQS